MRRSVIIRLAFCMSVLIMIELMGAGLRAQMPDSVQQAQNSDTVSKEDLMNMDYDDLMAMDLSALVDLADKAGVSTDELLQLALNRKASIASGRSETVFESPLTTYVITREDILSSGYTAIPELFKMVPGAIVRQKTNGNYDVTFRGMDNVPPDNPAFTRENSTLLLMVDNRIVYNYLSGGIFWETLPITINDIERIDIVLGAASSLYGPNATTGVINIVTLHDSYRPSVNVHIARGLYHQQQGEFSFSSNINSGWSTRITGFYGKIHRTNQSYYSFMLDDTVQASRLRNNDFEPLFTRYDREISQIANQRYGGTVNLYCIKGSDFQLRLSGGLQESRAQTISFDNYVTPLTIRTSRSGFADFSLHYKQIQAQVNYNDGKMDLAKYQNIPIAPYFRSRVFNADLHGDFQLTKWFYIQPRVGYSNVLVTDHQLIPSKRTGYFNKGHVMNVLSMGLRLDANPIKQLRFIVGLRDDYSPELFKHAYSWQAVIGYEPSPKHYIRANYSRAARGLYASSLYANLENVQMANQLGIFSYMRGFSPYGLSIYTVGRYPAYSLSLHGNSHLKIPYMDMYELGYRWKITPRYQIEAVGFYSEMRHFDAPQIDSIVVKDPTTKARETYDYRSFSNMDMVARQYGGSLIVTMSPIDQLTLRLFGTYQHTQLDDYLISDGNRSDIIMSGTMQSQEYRQHKVSRPHLVTPQVFGGASCQVTLLHDKSLKIYGDVQFRTQEVFGYPLLLKEMVPVIYRTLPYEIRGNVSISYRVFNGITLYVAGHDLGKKAVQYGLGDPVAWTVVGGVRLAL